MYKRINMAFLSIFITLSLAVPASAFLRVDGTRIVDSDGNEVILRGMGLGGWMLMEGYMMKTAGFAGTQHELEAKIADLIGEDGKDEFFRAWWDNHVTRQDIDSLKAWGFNSVRLPMHYKMYTLPIEEEPISGVDTWLEHGFAYTDTLLNWCEANEMYLILDLHGAPGGQGKDSNISDYDPSKPSLWESAENRRKMAALWGRLADRYKNEEWIGGYDLLNETNWDIPGNTLMLALYGQVTNAIRAVDKNHIIYIEGNWFANDFTGLRNPWDDNMVYSFHKYWSHNDQGAIQYVLDLREQTQRPIWMGEAGENSNQWFTEAIKLFETHDIGWAWWPMKKIDNLSGIYSIPMTDGYQAILDYWQGNGNRPDAETARSVLIDLAESSNSSRCRYQKDVADALGRQLDSDETIPFIHTVIPGKIYAANFDLGTLNRAYYDQVYANYHVSTGNYSAWNQGWYYRNDAVDIGRTDAFPAFPWYVGWTEAGEWIQITSRVLTPGEYSVRISYSSGEANGAALRVEDAGEQLLMTTLPSTGGWEDWQTVVKDITLAGGERSLKISFPSGGINLHSLDFTLVKATGAEEGPTGLMIRPPFPNPAVTVPDLYITSLVDGFLHVELYDILGRRLDTLYRSELNIGEHLISGASVADLASGVYFYRIRFNESHRVLKFSYLQ